MQESEQTAMLGREMGKRGLCSDFISQQKIKALAQEENLLLEQQEHLCLQDNGAEGQE